MKIALAAQLTISNLQVDLPRALGTNPLFSWTFSTSVSKLLVIQTSYQISISQMEAGASDVWDSGVVRSQRSRLIEYTGPPLLSHTRYFWSAHIDTRTGSVSASSEFITGVNSPTPPLLIQKRDPIDALTQSFTTAPWIWTPEANPPNAPGEDRAFRLTYTPPTGKSAVSADILIAVDDRFSLYVNGQLVGASPDSNSEFAWKAAQQYYVILGGSGPTAFAIRGINLRDVYTGGDSPAGLLLAILITHSDGSTSTLTSGATWRASKVIPANFEMPSLDDSNWSAASVLGKYGTAPWNTDVVLPIAVTTVTPGLPSSTSTPTIATGSTSPASTSAGEESSSTSSAQAGAKNSSSTGAIIGGAISGVAVLIIMGLIYLYRKRAFRRRPVSYAETPTAEIRMPSLPLLRRHSPNSPPAPTASRDRLRVEPFLLPSPTATSGFAQPRKGQLYPSSHDASGSGLGVGEVPFTPVSTSPSIATTYAGMGSGSSAGADTYAVSFPVSMGNYHQERDGGGLSAHNGSIGRSVSGSRSGSGIATALSRARVQRLQELVSELNREIAGGAEGSAYASELRGRIAELTREESVVAQTVGDDATGLSAVPPPYRERPGKRDR
ncbi:hypothetical protein H0H81_007572 [Sphagnurus paluster]|uniref:Uncharacterized protein n=1 Tax=Sphagnurus paluster TaxID=117069 RepID=A0A9P7GQR0_9AGAR|nr:hypothetical protein H0H81_007572 [Sphagnurus paluster]